ncbi:MAG: SDR family oxidoreductase [Synechococcales cyanobacterium RM1_1_8]|nr:SDR family oxidoreductase [Synechococcales cyanobacterium RM1_1_8]NJR71247.1 SDR family oxidoreductase [Synechococcales cyanobacterium CRU_2_2]
MKAIVAGATGKTGYRIVQQLVAQGIPVKALVRDAAKAKAMLPPEAEIVLGDVLDPKTLTAALADCTVLLSATGAAPSFDPSGPYKVDFEGTKNLVEAAKQQGIEQFVLVSSLCVSKLFHPLNLFWLILVWKKQAEAYLQNSGLTYTIVRPGGLKEADSDDKLVMAKADQLFEGSLPRQKVAQVCVAALGDSAAKNKVVEIVARPEAPEQPLSALFAAV